MSQELIPNLGMPRIGTRGLRTSEGEISGPMVWSDGEHAEFDTPQGRIRVSMYDLKRSDGTSIYRRR